MNIKKILAGGLTAIAAGATVAFGAFAQSSSLGDYVSVSDGTLTSPAIVIASSAAHAPDQYPMDVVGAADIAAAVAGYATTPVSVGGGTETTVSGGAKLSTTSTKIYLGDSLTKSGLKTTLTSNDLPNVLASGAVSDSAGNSYPYDQYITVGAGTVTFGKVTMSDGSLSDPQVYINTGASTTTPLYNMTIVFNKVINVSNSDVQGNTIELFGQPYSIGAGSDYNTLILYASSNKQTISQGETVTVNIDGTDHDVGLIGTSSSTQAVITVDGESKTVTKGNSYTISGVNVYVEDVFYFGGGANAPPGSVVLSLSTGSSKLTLEDGDAVKVGTGTSETTIDGTLVTITGTSGQGISKITISVTAPDTSSAYILEGTPFSDPVFGSFKVAFGGMNTGATDTIKVDNSGTTGATVQMTDARGNQKTLTWAYTSSTSFSPRLNSSSAYQYHVVEGETVKKNDYVILSPSQESEFSHIFQYTSSSSLGSSGAYIDLRDVMSGTTTRVYLTDSGYKSGSFYVDGQQYFVTNASATGTSMKFTWGSGASAGSAGNSVMVYPLVKLKRGEWIAFTTNVTLTDGTTYELPTNTSFTYDAATMNGTTPQYGQVEYRITSGNVLTLADGSGNGFDHPSLLVLEEKGKDSNDNDVKNAVIVTVGDGSGSGVDLTIQAPTFTDSMASSASKESDTSVTVYGDRYGVIAEYDSDNQGLLTITYPDDQTTANVAIGSDPQFSTSGTAGTVEQAVHITTPVAKLANEINTDALSQDLILLGGPCANELVAQLMGTTKENCLDVWTYSKGIIKEYDNAFGSGHKALVVAGTTGQDTRDLAAMVMQGTLSYEA